jgi:hypothetical protein
MRSSLVMALSVIRLRLIYSPFYNVLKGPLGPVEAFLYRKLRAPLPLPAPNSDRKNSEKK